MHNDLTIYKTDTMWYVKYIYNAFNFLHLGILRMFKSTLTIATSVFLLMSGVANLFAMDLDEAHSGQRTSTKTLAPLSTAICQKLDDMMPQIVRHAAFTQCLDNELPVNLALVCTDWFKII
jgi:hypothetical protein